VRLALAQLAVAMQIDSFEAMADACATELYKHVLQSSQQDFVTGTDTWPAIRTVYDQQATKPLSPQTIENRNSTLKALYKQMDCQRPLFDSEEGYWWLPNVEQVMRAATHKPDGSLKCLNSVKTTGKAVSALCEATGKPDLKEQYRLAFAKAVENAPTKPKRELTPDQIKLLYDIIAQLREQAMKLHCLQDTQRYLVLALHYGDAPGFLPQRNDMRSFRYAGPDIDSSKSNVISIKALPLSVPIRLGSPPVGPGHSSFQRAPCDLRPARSPVIDPCGQSRCTIDPLLFAHFSGQCAPIFHTYVFFTETQGKSSEPESTTHPPCIPVGKSGR
jgi:hypothetical protein